MRDFKKLLVWAKAHRFTIEIYRVTTSFPSDERYGLTSQLRRAAASVPANLAEGYARCGDTEFAHFLSIAYGSAAEAEYHLILAHDLGYLMPATFQRLAADAHEVQRMLAALRARVRPPASGARS